MNSQELSRNTLAGAGATYTALVALDALEGIQAQADRVKMRSILALKELYV